MDEEKALSKNQCTACKGGVDPLKGEAIEKLLKQLSVGWSVENEHHLEREFKFKNFAQALEFVNQVGGLAEQQGHHPDIYLSWGRVKVTLCTHKIDGLHENDFILAAKIDQLSE